MALTATYDPTLSRIRLAATALGATATRCVFWRTTNNFATYATIRGGWPVPVAAQNAAIDDYEFEPGVPLLYRVQSYTDADLTPVATYDVSITQDLDQVWVKVPALPFLNRAVTASVQFEISRRARGGVFDVVGRTYPVSVSDVRSSRQFNLQVRTATAAEYRDFDLLLASGEPVFLHVPSENTRLPGGYFTVGDTTTSPTGRRLDEHVFTLPLTEVAAPGPDVVGSSYTWSSLLAEYANWSAVLTGNATWADVLERIGSPSEVIVP
jgi:hypothetical protein